MQCRLGIERGDRLSLGVLDLGGRPEIRLEMGHDPGGLEILAVHTPRGCTMGQREQAVVREVRIAHKRRLAGNVVQKHAGRRVREVHVAEGRVALVVEHGGHQAGRRLEDGDQPAHAIGHAEVGRPAFGEQLAEDRQRQEGIDHGFAVGLEGDAGLGQQIGRSGAGLPGPPGVGPRRLDPLADLVEGHDLDLELP